jgi:two-component system C4-dicarboxylate transport sensor histidine kinase DctB
VILQRDIGETLLAARLAGALIGGLIGVLLGLGVVLIEANRRRRERQRSELERLVADRTTALETSNRQLLHEIDERIRSESTVQQLREDLAQANRLAILGQISAGVAHEINQPTAAIRTYVDNARKLFERGDHGAALATLSTIASLSERIGFITEELREFSRRSPGRKEPVRLHDVIEGSRLLLEPQLRLRGITLLRPRAPETQRVLANKTRLEQVVVNLIQNAMDALSETRDGTISIDAGGNGHKVWLSIADNGPGVPPERRAQLFAPFSSTKPLGLGLGLVICRDIIADLGGSLEFAPAPDGGAIFTARLPECTT